MRNTNQYLLSNTHPSRPDIMIVVNSYRLYDIHFSLVLFLSCIIFPFILDQFLIKPCKHSKKEHAVFYKSHVFIFTEKNKLLFFFLHHILRHKS